MDGKFRYLPNWIIETYKCGDDTNLGDVGVIVDGEFASVLSMNCILRQSDYDKLTQLDERHRKERGVYFKKYRKSLFHNSVDVGQAEWNTMWEQHKKERDAIYAKGELYTDSHRFLAVGSPYAYELLCKYRDTGDISQEAVARVLNIMTGKDVLTVPKVEREFKW